MRLLYPPIFCFGEPHTWVHQILRVDRSLLCVSLGDKLEFRLAMDGLIRIIFCFPKQKLHNISVRARISTQFSKYETYRGLIGIFGTYKMENCPACAEILKSLMNQSKLYGFLLCLLNSSRGR